MWTLPKGRRSAPKNSIGAKMSIGQETFNQRQKYESQVLTSIWQCLRSLRKELFWFTVTLTVRSSIEGKKFARECFANRFSRNYLSPIPIDMVVLKTDNIRGSLESCEQYCMVDAASQKLNPRQKLQSETEIRIWISFLRWIRFYCNDSDMVGVTVSETGCFLVHIKHYYTVVIR